MIPGEIRIKNTDIEINPNSPETVLEVKNTGDRPIQIGSHFHFFEPNLALDFERDKAYGKHLDIPAGAAVRFEPGDVKQVQLVEYAGNRRIYGFRGFVNGPIDGSRVYRPTGEDDKYAGVFNDEGHDNVNKKGGTK